MECRIVLSGHIFPVLPYNPANRQWASPANTAARFRRGFEMLPCHMLAALRSDFRSRPYRGDARPPGRCCAANATSIKRAQGSTP